MPRSNQSTLSLRRHAATGAPATTETEGLSTREELLEQYRQLLPPSQFTWLRRGLAVVQDVPPEYVPGGLEGYEADAVDDRERPGAG